MKTASTLALVSTLVIPSFAFAADAPSDDAPLTPAQIAKVRALIRQENQTAPNAAASPQAAATASASTTAPAPANDSSTVSVLDRAIVGFDKDDKFIIETNDGRFKLNIGGFIQTRFIVNNSANKGTLSTPNNGANSNDNAADGFDLRRVDLNFNGSVGQSFGYVVDLRTRVPTAGGSDDNTVGVNTAYGVLKAGDQWSFQVGKFYIPFTREQALISAANQVAVETSAANNFFSANRAVGLQVGYSDGQNVRVQASVTNGANSEGVQWNASPSQFAGAARVDWLALGDFKDVRDNFGLADAGKQALIFGLAGYEQINSNGGSATADNNTAVTGSNSLTLGTPAYNSTGVASTLQASDVWGATADALYKVDNFSFYGAAYASHADAHNVGKNNLPTPWGLEGQIDYKFWKDLDVYTQYSYINSDASEILNQNKPLHEIIVGANYFFNSHVKLTGDVVWVVSGGNPTPIYSEASGQVLSAGSGLVNDTNAANPHATQVAGRLQLQVSF